MDIKTASKMMFVTETFPAGTVLPEGFVVPINRVPTVVCEYDVPRWEILDHSAADDTAQVALTFINTAEFERFKSSGAAWQTL